MASNTTYYQYEDVKRNIAHRLFNMDGWKVYGYHADESDFMTDYYSPAYWNGIAEKNGYILVVDRSDERTEPEYTIKRTYNTTPAETAAKIAKLERMTQERGASEAEEATARAKIEALKAKENAETVEEKKLYAPAHKANPPRCNWHIEKDGVIYDKGTGLLKFYRVPDISDERELKDWQNFNNTTPEEWKAEEARRESWRWNESEERAAEIAESRYNDLTKTYELLNKFNELLARFNNVCGGSVGNTESGYYTYEQVKVTKYKKELKPKETENGSIKDGQCFIIKHNFTGGCNRGYVYRIHESEYTSAKTGETVKTYHAYRLGKGYKNERTGNATRSNYFSLYNMEKFLKWIEIGAIAFCELVEVSTPYEVTKTVKKHITPEASEEPQTVTETDEATASEEEPTNEPESTTEPTTDGEKEPLNPEELTGVFGEIVKGVEKLEEIASETPEQFAARCEAKTAEIFPAKKVEAITADIMESVNAILDGADTSETIPPEEVPTEDETATGAATETQKTASEAAPDMFAELAKAYFTGKTAPAIRPKAKKETDPKNNTAEAETTATADESEPEKPTAPPLKSDYGYTGEASDTFTTEEIDTLTSGGQVERIGKYDRRYIYISAKYNDRTALIYQTEANAGKIQPGKSLDYCGFITGGKFYRGDNKGIIESLQADINAAILQKLPTEEAAQANAEQTKGADSYNMRTAEELKQREYTEEARRKFCMGEEPQLKVYYNHYPESESAIIKYIEDPAQYIEERAAEYIEARPVEILKNYIIYNRTAPHYYNIAADPGNMAHQLKRMAAAVTDQKTLRIELTDGATIRAEASAIKYIGNRGKIYSCNYNLIDGERESRADIMPEEIKAIYHGQRTLYRAA